MSEMNHSPLTAAQRQLARQRLVTMHFKAGVGHTGGNLSALDAMLVVFHNFLQPDDRFILSKGHSAGALYTALWSAGKLSDDDLNTFHKDGTLLAGHPPCQGLPDVPFATGSLGHGLSLAAGTALGKTLQGQPGHVYCMTSDGEWQEGSTWEALIFACHRRMANLTVLIDHNGLQGFGGTDDVASMSPLWDKLTGFDADLQVIDGHDMAAVDAALRTQQSRVRIIVLRTVKGHGVSFMANQMAWHYLPMSEAQYQQAMQDLEQA
jgi:transketolase